MMTLCLFPFENAIDIRWVDGVWFIVWSVPSRFCTSNAIDARLAMQVIWPSMQEAFLSDLLFVVFFYYYFFNGIFRFI